MSFFECFCGKVITRNHTCPKDFKYHFNDGKSGSNPSSMCIKCLELFKKSHKCGQRIVLTNNREIAYLWQHRSHEKVFDRQ